MNNLAFDAVYANCLELVPFMTPVIEATLTTEDENPGVAFLPFSGSGRKAIMIRKLRSQICLKRL